MSLDISLHVPATIYCERCGHVQGVSPGAEEPCYSANITHNLNDMASAAGLYEALWHPEMLVAPRGDDAQIRELEAQGQLLEALALQVKLPRPKARDLIEYLRAGLVLLRADPAKYRALAPANGWGTYETLVHVAAEYLSACETTPDAFVEVSR